MDRILFLGIFPVVILCYTPTLKAQETHEFDISVAGFSIGKMTAKKTQTMDTTTFSLVSSVSLWLFGQITVDHATEVKYVGDRFIKSNVKSSTNKGDFFSRIWLEDGVYRVDANAYKHELKTTIREPIYFSAARLFFEEPHGRTKMVAETYGIFADIKRLPNGSYETTTDGNKNRYTYVNGKLERASIQSPVKNYVMKRKE